MSDLTGLDTNLVFRWLVEDTDSPGQSQMATAAVAGIAGRAYINLVVLAELIWLLSAKIKVGRDAQVALVQGLLDHPSVALSDPDIVRRALDGFITWGADFTDHLIAAQNKAAGCNATLTFDRAAARNPAFTLLT